MENMVPEKRVRLHKHEEVTHDIQDIRHENVSGTGTDSILRIFSPKLN